jgi:type II secretory pathway component PulL
VKLHSVKYSERSVTLELTLPNYQALDGVTNAFKAANLDVEVLAANGRGDEVDGRLRVRPGGAKTEPRRES